MCLAAVKRERTGVHFRCIGGELERFLVVEHPKARAAVIARTHRRNPITLNRAESIES